MSAVGYLGRFTSIEEEEQEKKKEEEESDFHAHHTTVIKSQNLCSTETMRRMPEIIAR